MSASGGRRIKRSLNIDTTSIHFLDEQAAAADSGKTAETLYGRTP
jgi:hypothetical protein